MKPTLLLFTVAFAVCYASNAFPHTPSSLFTTLQAALRHPTHSPIPPSLIPTSASIHEHLIDYDNTPSFAQFISDRLLKVQEEVLISTMTYDRKSQLGKDVAQAIRDLNERVKEEVMDGKRLKGSKVRVWLVVDAKAATFFQHQMPASIRSVFRAHTEVDPSKLSPLPSAEEVPYLDFRLRTFSKALLGVLHSKMMLIDGHIALLGSKNIEVNDAVEHMVELQGQIVRSLRVDFQRIWGMDSPLPRLSKKHALQMGPRDGEVPALVVGTKQRKSPVSSLTGYKADSPQNVAFLTLVENARSSIFIQTPNFSSKPIVDAVIDATERGVNVTIVTSYIHGDTNQRMSPGGYGSNQDAVKRMYRKLKERNADESALNVCWFRGLNLPDDSPPLEKEWSHIKAMVVDGQVVMFGSGNQDPQSWFHSREVNVVLDGKAVARKMLREFIRSQRSLDVCEHTYGS